MRREPGKLHQRRDNEPFRAMISFSTWRELFRIPVLRENREAVRILSDMFYLLAALFRAKRIQEFCRLSYLYFQMIESFAQYGSVAAKGTLDQMLQIPWFRENQRELYRLIAAYKRVVGRMPKNGEEIPTVPAQTEINRDMEIYFLSLKTLMHFDEKDQGRVNNLLEHIELLDKTLEDIHKTLGY